MEKRWFGAREHGTVCFFYSGPDVSGRLREQSQAVLGRLEELLAVRDGNGQPVVQLAFVRSGDGKWLVAYRWTSDWAYSKFQGTVRALGGSLGHGTFDWEDPVSMIHGYVVG